MELIIMICNMPTWTNILTDWAYQGLISFQDVVNAHFWLAQKLC